MKKIIHIDADCFYAAVETRENPKFEGIPLAVGGLADKRGVIATCNYEARKYGIHSAMSSAVAKQRCPHLLILRPRLALYRKYSEEMRSIFHDYTDIVEPLSLDEAFLDVSNSQKLRGSASLMAKEIKARVYKDLGITVSAGVAPVKFLAKIASDWKKPDGFFLIKPEDVAEFVAPLDVKKLPGVGPVAAKKLSSYGIQTCKDIRHCGLNEMVRLHGAFGSRLFQMSGGEDDRQVSISSERKSVSVERTYEEDITDLEQGADLVSALFTSLLGRWENVPPGHHIKGVFVKVKFNDFSVTTLESSSESARPMSATKFHQMLLHAWSRKRLPVRLLGIGYRLDIWTENQLELPLNEP